MSAPSQLLLGDAVDACDAWRPVRGPGARCMWCRSVIPPTGARSRPTRRDAFTCSKACRQASWRFGFTGPDWTAAPGSIEPRRFAYADPPYPGMSWRYYRDHPDYAGEVDHASLIARLVADYPDGWALSTSNKTLRLVLALIPDTVDIRIGAWTRPSAPRRARRGRVAWEPVIFAGGRPRPPAAPMLLDWVHAAPMREYPGAVVGTKPPVFSVWVFNMLGAQPVDTLDDLYIGSGAVTRAWRRYIGAETPQPSTRRAELGCDAGGHDASTSDVSARHVRPAADH